MLAVQVVHLGQMDAETVPTLETVSVNKLNTTNEESRALCSRFLQAPYHLEKQGDANFNVESDLKC